MLIINKWVALQSYHVETGNSYLVCRGTAMHDRFSYDNNIVQYNNKLINNKIKKKVVLYLFSSFV